MLAHDVTGSAPRTIALLHGIGGGRAIWDAAHGGTAQALARAGWRVVAFDLPGYGDSPLPPRLDVAAMADAVVSSLRELGARPAVLLGHSMGGMVAQEIAATDPDALSALVLVCTSSAFGRPGGNWQQGFLQARLAPLDAGLGMASLARQLVPAMVAPDAGQAAIAAGIDVMASVPEATYRAALHAIVGFDRRASLGHIGAPTLCLSAGHDRTAPSEVMQRMSERLPGGRHRCVASAGHLLPVEAPEAFVGAVVDFLENHVPVPPG